MLRPGFLYGRLMPLTVVAVFCLASVAMQAQNQLEFSLVNQRISADCDEYTAELWVSVSEGNSWEITNSEIGISYNTDALTAQDLAPAFEANQTLIDADVNISQSPGSNFVRLTLLRSSGSASISGDFKLLTLKFDIDDPTLLDELSFITTDPTTKIFDDGDQLNAGCGDATCFGVTDPTARKVGATTILSTPASLTVCSGDEINWNISVNACNPSYDWQELVDGVWESTGVETSTYSIDEVATDDAGTYRVVVSADDADDVTSDEFSLAVNLTPSISEQPLATTVCEGEDAAFTVEAEGDNLRYEWQLDSGDGFSIIDGQTEETLNLTAVTPKMTGNIYRARVFNDCEVLTEEVELTVNTAPFFATQPLDINACEGTDAEFMIELTGSPAPAIQWETYDAEEDAWMSIEEATDETFVVSEVSADLEGTRYRAVVKNTCGELTSDEVTLGVYFAPVVETQPEDLVACETNDVEFSFEATGTPVPSIEWQVDNGNGYEVLDGQNSSVLALEDVTARMDGNIYRARITNECSEIFTEEVELTVNQAPSITEQPVDVSACDGSQASFSLEFEAQPEPAIQWEAYDPENDEWVAIEDATESTYIIDEVSAEMDGGMLRAVLDNECGAAISNTVMLTYLEASEFVSELEDAAVCDDESATFTFEAAGNPAPSVRWETMLEDEDEWSVIDGETGTSYTYTPVDGDDGRMFRVVLTNECGEATSEAVLSYNLSPEIAFEPNDGEELVVCENGEVLVDVRANGTNLNYIWSRDGEELDDQTGSALIFDEVSADDAGVYTVSVFNDCDEVSSEGFNLVVNLQPQITAQPEASQDICEEQTFEVMVEAVGTGLEYQWQKFDGEEGEWFDLEGENSNTLSYEEVELDMAGDYRVVVSGTCEDVETSRTASLTVLELPRIADISESQTICELESVQFNVEATGTDILYQWYFEGDEIEGEVGASLTINPVNLDDEGRYHVIVSGTCQPIVESAPIDLTVTALPDIVSNPVSDDVCMGSPAGFQVIAEGPGPLNYQWQFSLLGENWETLENETAASINFDAVEQRNEGYYRAFVTGACPRPIFSEAARLVIYDRVTILEQPENVNACENDDVSLYVGAIGTPVSQNDNDQLQYRWFKDNEPLAGGFRDELRLDNIRASQAGTYRARITGFCNEVWSEAIEVSIQPAPLVQITSPTNVRVFAGEAASFTASDNCGPDALYQWYRGIEPLSDSERISGANGLTLTINSVTPEDRSSNYFLQVECECGIVQSDRASLEIDIAEINFTAQPEDALACDGEEVCFTASWDAGGLDVNLQWLDLNDQEIAGANDATYCTSNYNSGDGYKLRVSLVADPSVSTVSDPGRVTVQTAPVISAQPTAQTACESGSVTFSVSVSNPGVNGTSYAWFFNGTDLQVNNSELTLDNVSQAELGDYYVEISNDCGQVQSETVALQLGAETAITAQPTHPKNGQNFDFNELMDLSVDATGEGNCTYQWQFSADNARWDNIAGENATDFERHITTSDEVGFYRVLVDCECGEALASSTVEVAGFGPTSVGFSETRSLRLEQNYPNPFQGVTTIAFELKHSAQVELVVRDMFGRQVAMPLNTSMAAGSHQVQLDATALELGTGTYSYTVVVDGEALSRSMIVIR